MNPDWEEKPLSSLCKVFADGDWIESKDQSSDGIRLIQTGNVGNGTFKDRGEKARHISEETFSRLRCFEIFEDDCLISRLPDPVGRSCLLPNTGERMITAVDCTIVRFDQKKILPKYFCYYTQSKKYLEDIESETTGTTRSRISRNRLGEIKIPFPPLPEQQRIVAILDEAFAAIATAKANAEKNLVNISDLFETLLQTLFPDLEDVGKNARKLHELCELIIDCEHKTAPTQANGIPSIRTPNIGKGKLLLEGVYRVSEETYELWTRREKPTGGDLILAREAPAGNVAVIPEGQRVCLGQRTVLIRPKKNELLPEYLAQLLLRKNSQKRLLSTSRGATVQHVNVKDIRDFQIGEIPSIEHQQRVIDRVDDLFEKENRLVDYSKKKLLDLEELKKSILQKTFSGELTDG